MSNINFALDEASMKEYSAKLVDLHLKLMAISKGIDNIYSKLAGQGEGSVQWLGNGKEQCTAYFSLLDRYASLIAGEPIDVSVIITNSALDNKNSEGSGWRHIQELHEYVEAFIAEVSRFSFYSSDKAPCISQLENLNFYEG